MLRSNFEPGTTRWAVRRAQWRALGISDAEMTRPKIAVINSSSALSSCYAHLDHLSVLVQQAIREAGGLPFEIRTIAPSDFVTSAGRAGRYLMPARDLIVNDIEVMVEGAVLDGMVCLSSCDKTTPAHIMAAGRLNIPTILVIGGYQKGGICEGQYIDIDDVYESVGAVVSGNMSLSHLEAMTEVAVSSPGVCAGLGTANTMHIVAEALGMTLPGSTPICATGERVQHFATAAGRRIVAMIEEDLRPRHIITEAALHNAVRVVLAVAGSVNAVRHLAAIATETGLATDVVRLFERLAADTPLLCTVRPNGLHQTSDLEAAGGTLAVMKRLRSSLNLKALTVRGETIGEMLETVELREESERVIRPPERPVSRHGGLTILRGTLAPDGAIVKVSAVPHRQRRFAGPARVFDSEAAAMKELAAGHILPGDVVVLRGMGPRGGPGTAFAAGFVAALVGAKLSQQVAVVTDGELSGLNRGITVGQVMPEAAEGGPLGAVRNGDTIVIDLDASRLDILVEAAELHRRLSEEPFQLTAVDSGWLSIYRSIVQPVAQGATLGNRFTAGPALSASQSDSGYQD